MAMLNVFDGSAFSMANLTEAINKAPYAPSFLGSLGVFEDRSINTTTAKVEDRQGELTLLNTAARGAINDARTQPQRTVRNFEVPHVPLFQTILAEDVQNIRAFGSETELMAVGQHVNDQLAGMRANHEVTHEWHRIGAIKGQILDGDGSSTILDLYTAFGLSANAAIDFDLSVNTNVKASCNTVIRSISDALGMTTFSSVLAICGNTFFDELVNNTSVKDGYERWQSSRFFRETQIGPEYSADMAGFDFGNITWVNYRGKIGDVDFIAAGDAWFIPRGVPGMYISIAAPADFMETVNTRGQKMYAKQRRLDFDKGVELHTQSNVLYMCTRPKAIFKATNT